MALTLITDTKFSPVFNEELEAFDRVINGDQRKNISFSDLVTYYMKDYDWSVSINRNKWKEIYSGNLLPSVIKKERPNIYIGFTDKSKIPLDYIEIFKKRVSLAFNNIEDNKLKNHRKDLLHQGIIHDDLGRDRLDLSLGGKIIPIVCKKDQMKTVLDNINRYIQGYDNDLNAFRKICSLVMDSDIISLIEMKIKDKKSKEQLLHVPSLSL